MKIGKTVINLMDDTLLATYIPQLGFRILLRGFISKLQLSGSNPESRKQTLLDILKSKLEAGRMKRKLHVTS